MQKRSVVLILLFTVLGCGHQQNILQLPQLNKTVFYPARKPSSAYRNAVKTEVRANYISIAGVGDIMLGSHVIHFLNKYGNNYPFDSTASVLKSADLSIGNLEAPFSLTGKKFDKTFNFKVPPRYASGLVHAGFDVLNLANNHMMDYGREALVNTLKTLDSLGLGYCGAGQNSEQALAPVIVESNGIKVAFIGCSLTFPVEFWATKDSAGTYSPRENELVAMIQDCEQVADYTIVSFHWSSELRSTPKPYQKNFAHLSIDAGADLVLGHHPHVLQGVELYRNRLIIYSLGNFAFGSYTRKAKEAAILKTYLTNDGLLYARFIPINVYNYEVNFQPRVFKGTTADSVIAYMNEISLQLNNNKKIITKEGFIWGDWHTSTQGEPLTANN